MEVAYDSLEGNLEDSSYLCFGADLYHLEDRGVAVRCGAAPVGMGISVDWPSYVGNSSCLLGDAVRNRPGSCSDAGCWSDHVFAANGRRFDSSGYYTD